MPTDEETRAMLLDYCTKDLPGDLTWHVAQFGFINDVELRQRLGRAYYSARYVAKLMEALFASGDELHAFVKFQIIQYASIFEAVISNLLWNRYKTNSEVKQLQTHKAYKPVSAFGHLTTMKFGEEDVYTCVYRDEKTDRNSISFRDKVDCAVRIGFVDGAYAEDIKNTYMLRNLAHIETETEKQIEVEIADARTGYRRIKPFLEKIVQTMEEEENA